MDAVTPGKNQDALATSEKLPLRVESRSCFLLGYEAIAIDPYTQGFQLRSWTCSFSLSRNVGM